MSPTNAERNPTLVLPDNSAGGIYCYSSLLGSLAGSVSVVYFSFTKAEPLLLLAAPILLASTYLVFRAITTSSPGSISIKGDLICLTDVPSFRIWLDNAIVPLVIKKNVSINKADFQLEWLGQSLTWNDLQAGRSVHLARSNEAQSLLAWLHANGISVPPLPV